MRVTWQVCTNKNPDKNIIILGDVNNYNISKLCIQLNLTNVITPPTRLNKILDVILLDNNIINYYNNPNVGPPIANSDHKAIILRPLEQNVIDDDPSETS